MISLFSLKAETLVVLLIAAIFDDYAQYTSDNTAEQFKNTIADV